MRILNVNTTIDPVTGGGTAERAVQLSRCFSMLGHECALLTLDLNITKDTVRKLEGVALTALPCILPRYYLFSLPQPRIQELVKWADVVHIVGHWTSLNAMAYAAARKVNKPYVVCPAGALQIYGRSRWLKRGYNLAVGNRIVRNARACVAISHNEIQHFKYHGVPDDRIILIPNGIDPSEFAGTTDGFRERFNLPSDPFILFMGRLNSIKGPDLLLQAFVRAGPLLQRHRLVFAGPDGGMLSELRRMVSTLNAQHRVHFIGHLDARDKVAAYRAAEMLVIPSRQEAMSIVVLEAGACNRAVLLTDRCGFDDVQRVGGGRVVSASIDGLQSGLVEMTKDNDRLSAMGERLGAFVRQNFLWKFAGEKYLALFSRLLGAQAE